MTEPDAGKKVGLSKPALTIGVTPFPGDPEPKLEDHIEEQEAADLEKGGEGDPFGATIPPGADRPASKDHPPFELPSGEDDPEGHAPAHHTVESEVPSDLRKKIRDRVEADLAEYEEVRVEKAKKYLADVREIAPDVAKTVKSIYNSIITEGFSAEQALALTQTVIDKKFHPFL